MRFVSRTRPSPLHLSHGVATVPRPLHLVQVAICWNVPSGVRTLDTTPPVPPHLLQVDGDVPGFSPLPLHVPHVARRSMVISFLQPNTASRKSTCRSYLGGGKWMGKKWVGREEGEGG
jgi:hypothetical protein